MLGFAIPWVGPVTAFTTPSQPYRSQADLSAPYIIWSCRGAAHPAPSPRSHLSTSLVIAAVELHVFPRDRALTAACLVPIMQHIFILMKYHSKCAPSHSWWPYADGRALAHARVIRGAPQTATYGPRRGEQLFDTRARRPSSATNVHDRA